MKCLTEGYFNTQECARQCRAPPVEVTQYRKCPPGIFSLCCLLTRGCGKGLPPKWKTLHQMGENVEKVELSKDFSLDG